MAENGAIASAVDAASADSNANKTPRTARGRRTLRALLDAAAAEFGERGYHESSIAAITARAGIALGSFYTYFDSKDALFRALVADMSAKVRDHVTPRVREATDGLDAERIGLESFLDFVHDHREIYRIIDEAEFVDYPSYRRHYESTVGRIRQRLEAAAERGEVRGGSDLAAEVRAWAIGGMNVFLGLRFGVWDADADPAAIAVLANDLIKRGLEPR